MIKTILVDDEPRGINTLKKILELYCPDVQVIASCNDADSAKDKIEQLQPDLVFLDIAMPGKTSLAMLSELNAITFQIIFVTAHNEYSLQAFKYSAIDYLLKPVHEDELIQAVTRASKKIQDGLINRNVETLLYNIHQSKSSGDIKLCIPSLKGFQVIRLSDVIFCESETSYTVFHLTDNQKLVSSKPIFEYEQLLEKNDFVRIHRSYLVNINHVKEYRRGEGGTVVLLNGPELEVSRRKKDNFIAVMKEKFKF